MFTSPRTMAGSIHDEASTRANVQSDKPAAEVPDPVSPAPWSAVTSSTAARASSAVMAGCLLWFGVDRMVNVREPHTCHLSVITFLRSIDMMDYAASLCSHGYTRMEDVLHITDDECVLTGFLSADLSVISP